MKDDLFGGATAAVVALPLVLAFGVSSGAGALAGRYGAIFAGFMAAVFGGTRVQITGPTGPMTVVTALVITHFGVAAHELHADPQTPLVPVQGQRDRGPASSQVGAKMTSTGTTSGKDATRL